MNRLLFLLSILLTFPAGAQPYADQVELLSREDLMSATEFFQFKLGPEGKYLYYRERDQIYPNQGDRFHVLLLDSLHRGPGNIDYPKGIADWIPVRNGYLSASNPKAPELLFLWNSTPLQDHLKIKGDTAAKQRTSIKFLRTSADGNRVAMRMTFKDSLLNGLYVLDLVSGQLKRSGDLPDMTKVFYGGDFQLVAAEKAGANRGNELYFRSGDTWELIRSHEWGEDAFLGGFNHILSVSDDGQSIYFTSNKDRDKSALFRFDRATRKTTELAADERVDLLPFGASMSPDGHVTSAVGLFAKTIRHVVDPKVQRDFDRLEELIEGDISFGGASADDRLWLIREFTGGPNKLYLYNRDTEQLTFITSSIPDLDGQLLARRQAHSVQTKDGLELPFHVYLPKGSDPDGDGVPNQPLPTILYAHGGPWVGVVHWNQYFHWRNFQLLANRGYAVINCEFRSSTGLGKEFIRKGDKAWGTDMVADKVAIANWAAENGIANREKIGIWGWSYGGYATLAGLAFSPETYACGISMYAPTDLDSFGRIPFANTDFWHNRVGDPFDPADRDLVADHSPLRHAANINAPLLITTGSKDRRVPQAEMDRMASALKEAGKDVSYFYYPEEGHDYRQPESWISFWAVAETFLAEHLGGRREVNPKDVKAGDYVVVEGKELIRAARKKKG